MRGFGLVWISACAKDGDPRPVCPYLTGSTGRGTPFVVLLRAVVGACGGLCVPGAPGPSSGAWVPYLRLLRESGGRVTSSFLPPTTEPQRGARGVWSEVLLD